MTHGTQSYKPKCEQMLFQPVVHDWCNKGHGMCYPVCGMMHIKEPLLLIRKSNPCGDSGFPVTLSECSFTICLTPYNCKYNVLSASLNNTFPSFLNRWYNMVLSHINLNLKRQHNIVPSHINLNLNRQHNMVPSHINLNLKRQHNMVPSHINLNLKRTQHGTQSYKPKSEQMTQHGTQSYKPKPEENTTWYPVT